MKQRLKVEVGQRYQSVGTVTGAPVFTYRVAELFLSKVDKVEYARLEQVDEPSRSKSIAAQALLNTRHFIAVDSNVVVDTDRAA